MKPDAGEYALEMHARASRRNSEAAVSEDTP